MKRKSQRVKNKSKKIRQRLIAGLMALLFGTVGCNSVGSPSEEKKIENEMPKPGSVEIDDDKDDKYVVKPNKNSDTYIFGEEKNDNFEKQNNSLFKPNKEIDDKKQNEPNKKPIDNDKKPSNNKKPSEKPIDNDKKPNDNKEPEEKPNKEECKHNFSNWYSLNDDYEERYCNNCDEKEIRPHSYLEEIKYIPNNDGTYLEITTKTCISCSKKLEQVKTKECIFGDWIYNPDTLNDERTCQISGYVETRKHIHNYGSIYEYDKDFEYKKCVCGDILKTNHNLNSTDFGSYVIYSCTNEGCDYSYTLNITPSGPNPSFPSKPEHVHNYEEFVKADELGETWKCKDDEEVITKAHSFDAGVYNPLTNEVEYKCLNDKCDYQKTEIHSEDKHKYPSTPTRSEDEYEVFACEICGKVTTKLHNYPLVANRTEGSCDVSYTCTNEGCGHTKYEKQHSYERNSKIDYNGEDENKCYSVVYKCQYCDDTYTDDIPHVKHISEDDWGITTTCENCSYYDYELKFNPTYLEPKAKVKTLNKERKGN